MLELSFIWAGIIAFAVFAYVLLDGFDLGLGILFPLFPEDRERTTLMNTIAPVWDGNETWLVLGGGGMLAAFPLAYAVVMPALYAPVIAMLLALVFRGVAFEFRSGTKRGRRFWDAGFWLGSTVAAVAQGLALGALVQGIKVEGRAYAGGWWDWMTPFSAMTAVSVVIGYALLGATWTIWRTEGPLQERARTIATWAGGALLICIAVVSLWTPFLMPLYWARWFSWPQSLFTMLVPVLLLADAAWLYSALARRAEISPFVASIGLFALSFAGLGISFYPYIVPVSVTIEQAAAPPASLGFVLVGTAVLVPLILIYTAHAYWVFRGKVNADDGYH